MSEKAENNRRDRKPEASDRPEVETDGAFEKHPEDKLSTEVEQNVDRAVSKQVDK